MLEIAGELVGPVNDESKPLASAAPEQVPTDANNVPVPPDIKAIFQGGIFFLMLLGTCYAAAEVILPVVLAFVLMLVLQAGDAASRAMACAAWSGGARSDRDAVWCLNRLRNGAVGTCRELGTKAAPRHTKIAGAAQLS